MFLLIQAARDTLMRALCYLISLLREGDMWTKELKLGTKNKNQVPQIKQTQWQQELGRFPRSTVTWAWIWQLEGMFCFYFCSLHEEKETVNGKG